MKCLQSPHSRDVRICVNTVFKIISLKTEITRSARGQKNYKGPVQETQNGGAVPRAEIFGDLITADHKVLSDNCESRNNHRYAVVVQDLATQWIQAYPGKPKTSQETQRSLQKFLEPDRKPKVIYTDISWEFGKACEDLSWNHCTSTPHRSETDGIAERAVRSKGRHLCCICCNQVWMKVGGQILWNVTPICETLQIYYLMKTPYERRFAQSFKGPIIPFCSLVEYHPKTAKDQSRIHQFGKKVLPGLFFGYGLYAGWIWNGDVLIADLEELETMDASEIYSKRLNAKEVTFPKEKGEFIFSNRRWTNPTLGGDQDLRTSTLIRQRPIRGESHLDFLWESEGSLPPPHDSFPDAGEAINDFWLMSGNFIYRHHVEPRVKLYSPREESFPIPLKYIDVSRTTHTNFKFGCQARKTHRWLLEYLWVKRYVWSMDRFHSIYSIGRETSRRIFVVRGEIDEENSWHPGQIIYGQSYGSQWERMPSWRRSKSGHMKSSILNTHENCEGSISSTRRTRNLRRPSRMLARNWKHQWLLLCLAKLLRAIRIVGVVHPTKSNQILRVFWKLVNLQDCVWENHCRFIMKTILQEKETIHCSIIIWFTNLFLCLKPSKFQQQRQQLTRNGKNWRKFRRGTWQKSEVKKMWSMKQGRRAQKFILHHWWTYDIWKMLNWRQSTKNTKVELYSEVIL